MNYTQAYIEIRDKLLKDAGLVFTSRKLITTGPAKTVHYLEAGSGQPLIMVHGGGSHSGEWINIMEPLSRHYHLYVVDRPGCGLTDSISYDKLDFRKNAVQFLSSFMEAAGLAKANFLAQSMGGFFSICFAMDHPEKVDKLLLIGAPAGMNLWIPYLLRALGTRGLNRVMAKTVAKPSVKNTKFIHKQLLVAHPERLSDDYLELGYYSQVLPGGFSAFLSLLENVLTIRGWRRDLYIGDKLGDLQVPVRFIWGEKDAFEKPDTGREKASAINDLQFSEVEDAGHCPWLDQPEKCTQLVLKMLKE